MTISRFTVLILGLLLTVPSWADTMELGGFQFENPLGKASTTEIGRGAYSAHWPGDKPYNQADTELIVVSLGPSAVKTMTEGGGNVYEATLATMLGLFVEPKEINKTLFMGTTSARTVYQSGIPRKHEAHVFSKTLEDGSFVLVGARSFDPGSEGSGKLIQSIANTFKKVSR